MNCSNFRNGLQFHLESMITMAGMSGVFFLLLLCDLHVQAHTTFDYDRSNFYDLELSGNAVMIRDVGVSLTYHTHWVAGHAFYRDPVRMKDRSFSTTFVFSIIPSLSDHSGSGQGLSFVIAPNKYQNGALPAQYLGLLNDTSNGQAYNHLVAVEFDTFQSVQFQDINNNHVGVDLNDLHSVQSKSAGYWVNNKFRDLDLKSGKNIQAWIGYDHLQKELKVSIAPVGSFRPEKPLVYVKNMSLWNILEEEMYVGFSAATGIFVEDHYILAWSFTTNGTAPALNTSFLPSLLHEHSKSNNLRLKVGVPTSFLLLLFVVAVATHLRFKGKKHRDVIEEWEVEYWPHRFSYKDLNTATQGFREDQELGRGGFGRVYKGVLPTNGLEIAVKCILRQSSEGLKEFIAEISSLGRLQHRNLVQIRGYCKQGTQLFIVYDYMPNGSLDKLIFGNPQRVLGWAHRHRILRDVGAGLLYLHEGWEKRVVHRDIKSCNVLLDSELHGKVGDFGLARLYGHDENSLTTRVAGTVGYIAPEVVHTGKATPSSDVFSFGVLMLEVACGRRPLNPHLDAAQIVLLDWVRELHANDKLMDAADSKLGGEYVEEEMERVLKLGLLGSNPEPEARPGMKQVVQILEGEASLTDHALPVSFEMRTASSGGINASFSTSFEGR